MELTTLSKRHKVIGVKHVYKGKNNSSVKVEKYKSWLVKCYISAQVLTKSLVFHDWSKHIDKRYYFIRECIFRKEVNLKYVKTQDQVKYIRQVIKIWRVYKAKNKYWWKFQIEKEKYYCNLKKKSLWYFLNFVKKSLNILENL